MIDDATLRILRDAAKAQQMACLPPGLRDAVERANALNDQIAAPLALLADRHLAPLRTAASQSAAEALQPLIDAVARATTPMLSPTVDALVRSTIAAIQPAVDAFARSAALALQPAIRVVSDVMATALRGPFPETPSVVQSLQPAFEVLLRERAAMVTFDALIVQPSVKTSITAVEDVADSVSRESDTKPLRQLTDDERDHINLAVALLFAVLTTQYRLLPTLAAEITAGVWIALRYGTARLL